MGIRKSHGRFYKTESEQCTIKAIRPERRPEHPPHYKTRVHNKIKLIDIQGFFDNVNHRRSCESALVL